MTITDIPTSNDRVVSEIQSAKLCFETGVIFSQLTQVPIKWKVLNGEDNFYPLERLTISDSYLYVFPTLKSTGVQSSS